MDLSGTWIQGTGQYEIKQTAVDDGVLKKGDFYLECQSAGTIAKFSDQAYGEWEWDWYQGGTGNALLVDFMSDGLDDTGVNALAELRIVNTESIYLKTDGSGVIAWTDVAYIETYVWYRMKVTKTLDGVYTVYIKGGLFGVNDWTLLDVTGGSGTNPATSTGETYSKYFAIVFDVGDRIANLVMKKAVKQ